MASGRGPDRDGPGRASRPSGLRLLAYALLLGECLVILIPSVYASATPKLFGIPFFYWFQLMWIIVGMVVTGLAWLLVRRADAAGAAALDPREGAR
jgi:Protein of unknown function (DUF3311)